MVHDMGLFCLLKGIATFIIVFIICIFGMNYFERKEKDFPFGICKIVGSWSIATAIMLIIVGAITWNN
jgi:multisubunit Na+/H+ antiporter MnhB subunit